MSLQDSLVFVKSHFIPRGTKGNAYDLMMFYFGNDLVFVRFEKTSTFCWSVYLSSLFVQVYLGGHRNYGEVPEISSEIMMQRFICKLLKKGCSVKFIQGDEHGQPLI